MSHAFLLYFIGVLTLPVIAALALLFRHVTCDCELFMAKYGDIPLARNEDANSYWGPCPRCGKRYVKAVDWARSVLDAERGDAR